MAIPGIQKFEKITFVWVASHLDDDVLDFPIHDTDGSLICVVMREGNYVYTDSMKPFQE